MSPGARRNRLSHGAARCDRKILCLFVVTVGVGDHVRMVQVLG